MSDREGAKVSDDGQHHQNPLLVNGLPLWLNVTIVLTLLSCFVFVVVTMGERGLQWGYIIAVLLGTYLGIERVLKAWRGGGGSS